MQLLWDIGERIRRMIRKRNPGLRQGPEKEYRLTPADLFRWLCCAVPMCGLVAYTFYKSTAVFLVLLLLDLIFYPRFLKRKLREKQLRELSLGFRDALTILSGFLSAGYSVENGFEETRKELGRICRERDPIVIEFTLICRGLRVNTPIERLLSEFGERSGLQDIRSFAEVFMIAKRTGGDLKEIIEYTGFVLREKMTVSEEIRTMTAARQYEQKIMNILPVGIIFYINAANPGFLEVMYRTAAGRIVMTGCLMMFGAAALLQKKILAIEV